MTIQQCILQAGDGDARRVSPLHVYVMNLLRWFFIDFCTVLSLPVAKEDAVCEHGPELHHRVLF